MPWSSPAARLREYILTLRHIWDVLAKQGKTELSGRILQADVDDDLFDPGPIEYPHIPIYIAGVKRLLSRELAGELCEGFHVHPFHTAPYIPRDCIRPWVAAGAEHAGRTIGKTLFQ